MAEHSGLLEISSFRHFRVPEPGLQPTTWVLGTENCYFELICTPECSVSELDQLKNRVMTYCSVEYPTQYIGIPTPILGQLP